MKPLWSMFDGFWRGMTSEKKKVDIGNVVIFFQTFCLTTSGS